MTETHERKVALVTGGFGSLGKVIASKLLEWGAHVVVTHSPGSKNREAPAGMSSIPCDVTDADSVSRCFRQCHTEHGQLSIVVHTVGGFASEGGIAETSEDVWDSMMTLNARSSFLVLRESLRTLQGQADGRIILISALSALHPGKGAAAYKLSKGVVNGFVEIAHAELEQSGITVNALAPRIIDTPQNRRDMPEADPADWVSPHDIAATVLHLCSDAGAAISGDIITFP